MSELLVYKASAGSGKTFTLAVEYIKLLIFNPRAYRQILAVTFTNKATAEMKERILSQLYGIQIGDKDSEAYLNRIKEETGKTEQEIREAAGIALSYMLHDYSRFRVETIDSFFQSVMRNLARELELSPNLNIELNNTEVLSDAVDSMIEKLGPTSPVLAWLLDISMSELPMINVGMYQTKLKVLDAIFSMKAILKKEKDFGNDCVIRTPSKNTANN